MPLRHNLGYRLITTTHRIYKLFDWRKRDVVQPEASLVVAQATDGTAKKITYAITAVGLQGGTLTYDVNFGDGSGHATTSSGTHTYSTGGSKTVTVIVTDSYGSSRTVTGTVVADSAPTDIVLSASSIAHTAASGTTVGTLSATDVDTGDTYTWSLVAGSGSTDNASFSITGTALKLATTLTAGSYSVRVQVSDQNTVVFAKALTITVT